MGDPGLQGVSVTVRGHGPSRAADREALHRFVARVAAVDAVAVRTGRRCAVCGSDAHGRPWATVDDAAVHVSMARTTGAVALAVAPAPVGVDVERVASVAARPLDVFTAGERRRAARTADPDGALAACWAAKEAVLKRDGRGLRVDARTVDVVLGAGDDHAVFERARVPLVVVRPEPGVVLAVATGGLRVTVVDER